MRAQAKNFISFGHGLCAHTEQAGIYDFEAIRCVVLDVCMCACHDKREDMGDKDWCPNKAKCRRALALLVAISFDYQEKLSADPLPRDTPHLCVADSKQAALNLVSKAPTPDQARCFKPEPGQQID